MIAGVAFYTMSVPDAETTFALQAVGGDSPLPNPRGARVAQDASGEISKGNASMSLRELRTFGVVRQVEVPADRRDFYVTEPDVWTMFFRILRERKRREFDPALEAIHRLVEAPGASGAVQGRLEQMADLLTTMDGMATRFLKDPESSRSALAFLAGLPLGGGKKGSR